MLPFLKPKKAAGVTTVSYSGGESKTQQDDEHSNEEMFAAQDMMNAIHSKDSKAFLTALKSYHAINEAKEDDFASTPG